MIRSSYFKLDLFWTILFLNILIIIGLSDSIYENNYLSNRNILLYYNKKEIDNEDIIILHTRGDGKILVNMLLR